METVRTKFVSNLINPEDVRRVADSYGARTRAPDLKKWWRRNFRRSLTQDESLLTEIDNAGTLTDLYRQGRLCVKPEAWVYRDLRRGRPVHYFDPVRAERQLQRLGQTALILEWMRALGPNHRHRRRLERISVAEAWHLAREWQMRAGRASPLKLPESPDDVEPAYLFDDQFRIVRLRRAAAFVREAKLLKNCLHDVDRFAAADVYTLRDGASKPHAAIEFVDGLLMRIKGSANSVPRPKYHPYLTAFLQSRGVPRSEIIARMHLIDFNGGTYPDIDRCCDAFLSWADSLPSPREIPFMRHPTIREFLNVFAKHGRNAEDGTRAAILGRFRPRGTGWRLRAAPDGLLPGALQIHCPQFPAALLHLARYDALPRKTVVRIYRDAISGILEQAGRRRDRLFDLQARNGILTPETFADLLAATGLGEAYEKARRHAKAWKIDALGAEHARLSRKLQRQDLGGAERLRIRHTIETVYPALVERLRDDIFIL